MFSWRMLWGQPKPQSEEKRQKSPQWLFGSSRPTIDTEPLSFRGLLRESFKRSFSRGWIVFGVLGTLMPDIIAILQKYCIAIATVPFLKWVADYQSELRVGIALFVVVAYVIYAPYRIQKDKLKEAIRQLDSKDAVLGSYSKNAAQQKESVRQTMLNEAAQMLKHSSTNNLNPFHAVFKVSAGRGNLDNEDIIWLCNELRSLGHAHPFAGLDQLVFESEWLKFLKAGYLHRAFKYDKGTDYLDGALEWAKRNARSEPPDNSDFTILRATLNL